MSDHTDSTPRSIALRGNRSLSAVGNSLISRGLQDLADHSAKNLLALIEDVRAAVSDREASSDELAALVTKLTRAAIESGFSEFAEYTAYVDGMISGVDVRLSKIGEHIESAWTILGPCEEYSHIDPAGNVAELLEQREREQWETIDRRERHYRRLRHSRAQEQAKSDLTPAPPSMPSVQTDDIHEAARNGDIASVRQILKNDPVKVDARDFFHETPLHLAAQFGHADVAEVLLSHGADVDARSEWNLTPLHWAADANVAMLLLSHGADVHAQNNQKLTPLHTAAKGGRANVAEVLLSHGADVHAQDDCNCTPLHRAADQPDVGVAKVLLSHSAEVNVRDNAQSTPLHWAAAQGHVDVAELLLSHGADVNARNRRGNTPLDRLRGDAIAKMLRRHGGVSGGAVR